MSTDKKEYSLQDLYKDPSEEEDEEQDSDFVPEGLEEEEENEEFEESDEEDQDTKEKAERESAKRPLEDEKEDPQAKKARIEALWNDIKDTKKPMTNNNNNNNNNEQDVSKPLDSNNNDTPEKPKTKPKIARPKSTLSSLVSQYNIKVPKMNTLEKSKLDWKTFVEKEGIKDELTYKNKDGYVEKVEFLQRVDERRLRQLKAGQKETKKNE
ncbi:BCNT-domain-containing protein [Rhizopus microsporus var. microsporus]|uniref:SWR1-complex protein 5 n=1 Tax=Rhizopus microsporus var. microsporus TaxID=86635 RepID=A0A1X0R784_RHIZD|nr:BCNT-domain-containing protein [Rhizopus microsporus var. microsporus]